MNWFRRFVRWLAGGHDPEYHRLASEATARQLQSQLRKRRADKLAAELDLYRRGR